MQGVHACCDLREVVQVVESESDHYICIAFACIAKHFVFAGLRQPLALAPASLLMLKLIWLEDIALPKYHDNCLAEHSSPGLPCEALGWHALEARCSEIFRDPQRSSEFGVRELTSFVAKLAKIKLCTAEIGGLRQKRSFSIFFLP